jgi:hypothetical protein
MINKRDAKVFIVCLSCHFDVGLFHVIGQEVPHWRFSMIYVCLQWQELAWDHTWAYSRAGSGRAGLEKSPTQKMPAQAQPGLTVGPEISAPARGGYFLSGHRAVGPGLPKIFHFSCPGPAQLGYRADICCPGPARLHVLARRAGPFFGPGQAGPSGRAAHAQIYLGPKSSSMRFWYSYFTGHEIFNLWFVKHMLYNCTRIYLNHSRCLWWGQWEL